MGGKVLTTAAGKTFTVAANGVMRNSAGKVISGAARQQVLKSAGKTVAGKAVGSVAKGVFTPSHALSHYINPLNFKKKLDLTNFPLEVEKYLHGDVLNIIEEQFGFEMDNGYVLICYNNLGVGFGKATINNGKIIVKNHYPKGIRNL